jgi:uncharacterized MAPEG superfamily protein
MTGWELFTIATVGLFFKHVLTVVAQAGARIRSGRFRHAEDAKLANASQGDPPLAERAQDLIRNSLENEPAFLLVLFAFFALNTDGEFRVSAYSADHAGPYVATFLGARVLHAALFLRRIAGLRTLAYTFGLLATLGLAVQALMEVFD